MYAGTQKAINTIIAELSKEYNMTAEQVEEKLLYSYGGSMEDGSTLIYLMMYTGLHWGQNIAVLRRSREELDRQD